MPCSDSSARIEVLLGEGDRILGFEYAKITCGKEIGGGTGYDACCAGRPAEEVLGWSFDEALAAVRPADDEQGFFLYLEWDALRAALATYLGRDPGGDPSRYEVASIDHDADRVAVRLVVRPPADLPPIRACNSPSAPAPAVHPLAEKPKPAPCVRAPRRER